MLRITCSKYIPIEFDFKVSIRILERVFPSPTLTYVVPASCHLLNWEKDAH